MVSIVFDFKTFIHMVRFVPEIDKDEDHRFCLIHPDCVEFWVFMAMKYIHYVCMVAMFEHGSTMYVWFPWIHFIGMDISIVPYLSIELFVLIMGMPTSDMIIWWCCILISWLLTSRFPISASLILTFAW